MACMEVVLGESVYFRDITTLELRIFRRRSPATVAPPLCVVRCGETWKNAQPKGKLVFIDVRRVSKFVGDFLFVNQPINKKQTFFCWGETRQFVYTWEIACCCQNFETLPAI